MYTPNELREINFSKAVFGGYDAGEVDKAFKSISEDYATLFKENAMLKKKLKLLADTVEDYRSVDEAMRKALITAQNMANEMVSEAETKSKEMLANASDVAMAKASELNAQVIAEEEKLAAAKAETVEFIDKMTALIESEREKLNAIKNSIPVPEKAAAPVKSAPLVDTIDEIAKSLEEKVKLEEAEFAIQAPDNAKNEEPENDEDADVKKASDTISFKIKENNVPSEKEEAESGVKAEKKPARHHRVEFENLKFGTDYDIKNEK